MHQKTVVTDIKIIYIRHIDRHFERRKDIPFLLLLNLIMPYVMILVGYTLKKHPVLDIKSQNGYNTPTSRKSQEHWDYAQSIAPDIFISTGKMLGVIEIILSVIMFLFHTSSQDVLIVGGCVGIGFLLFGFYKTDSKIEKSFWRIKFPFVRLKKWILKGEVNLNLIHRSIDFENDRDYILERHCRINYACESPWIRKKSYLEYRSEWFSFTSQVSGFYGYLERTSQDDRTIAEIIEGEDGRIVGYLWVTFCEDEEMDFRFAEIQEIYIEEEFRRQGVATRLYGYAEARARRNDAKVIRAGTGSCNSASIQLHERLGFAPYRYEFEKLLMNKNDQ